jgi:hypothetical protein
MIPERLSERAQASENEVPVQQDRTPFVEEHLYPLRDLLIH